MDVLNRMPFLARNAVFEKLASIADVSTLTKEECQKYDASVKVLRDHVATYQKAVENGMKEGIALGKKEGAMQERRKTVELLAANGMSAAQIAMLLKIPLNEINSILRLQ